MKKLNLILFLVFCVISFSGFAQGASGDQEEDKTRLRFLVNIAAEFGGDEVAEVFFTNGDTQSVNAGQGLSGAVGGELQFKNLEKFRVRASIGYKYVTTKANNAHIRLTRIPIDISANWMIIDKLRVGVGLSMHQAIDFKSDGLLPDLSFDGAFGPKFEVAYYGFGLSYTIMNYTDQFNNKYSANSFGITYSFTYPN